MPRGVYERKPRHQVLPDRLRALADEIEEQLKVIDKAEEVIERLSGLSEGLDLPQYVRAPNGRVMKKQNTKPKAA